MIKSFAKIAATLSLILSAGIAAPAWSAGKESHQANCPYSKHKHQQAKRVAAPQPARSVMIVEHRKRDVQILSFGP